MRTLVCFGDSNTWGYIPGSGGERFPREQRWPVILQHELGDDWEVIAEGLGGRTATVDRPDSEGRNGLPYLLPCLHSHAPVDLVVIFLGTNDVNFVEDDRVARCVARLVEIARRCEVGDVLVVCPPPFGGHDLEASFRAELDCDVIVAPPYPIVNGDVEHLDAAGHAMLAESVAQRVR
ncbi:MAG TPA: GDSL-type esterase/lipase family protein [Gaiellaceae bacterium]|nr:GDSL-type esterase/lipase family protein [Gaiellaceae bacterium]